MKSGFMIIATGLFVGLSTLGAAAKTCERDYLAVTVGAVDAAENKRTLIKDKATQNWQFTANARYGAGFGYWQNARNTSIKCKRIDRIWFCTAKARACSR